jgi:hypothetical protein
MGFTQHCLRRMSQRGITMEQLNLVMRFGINKGDKIILNKKIIKNLLRKADFLYLKSKLLKLFDKGGVVVVFEDNSIITTYNVDSYRRARKY